MIQKPTSTELLTQKLSATESQALDEYLLLLDTGQSVDRQRFLTVFPQHQSFLNRYFETEDALYRNVSPPGGSLRCHQAIEESTEFDGFRTVGLLGSGAWGEVYKAKQVRLDRTVAIKLIHFERLANTADRKRFENEAKIAGGLRHPNIVGVFGAGVYCNRPYIAMEFVRGESLLEWTKSENPSIREACLIMSKVARAAHFAHQQGILHRDIKPSNILLEGNGPEPKIADFGLAQVLASQENLTMTDQRVGTPAYMAPEQLTGGKSSPAADIYSLGATLYHAVTGQPPFSGETPLEVLSQVLEQSPTPPRKIRPAVPKDIQRISQKCMNKQPQDRYSSAEQLAKDLENFLIGQPVSARPIGHVVKFCRMVRNQPKRWFAVFCAVLIAAAAGTSVYMKRMDEIQSITVQDWYSEILVDDLYEMFKSPSTPISNGGEQSLEKLEAAIRTVDARLGNQPIKQASMKLLVARLLIDYGYTHRGQAILLESIDHFERQVGASDRRTLLAKIHLVAAYKETFEDQKALTLADRLKVQFRNLTNRESAELSEMLEDALNS